MPIYTVPHVQQEGIRRVVMRNMKTTWVTSQPAHMPCHVHTTLGTLFTVEHSEGEREQKCVSPVFFEEAEARRYNIKAK